MWNGDVWRVDGVMQPAPAKLIWRRIASGLFQPLGVKFRGADVFITCRDQLVRLRDHVLANSGSGGAPEGNHDLVLLAVAHREYLALGADSLRELVANGGMLADLKGALGGAADWTL